MPSAMPPSSRAAPPHPHVPSSATCRPHSCRNAMGRGGTPIECSAFCPSRGHTSCVQGARESVQESLRDEAAQSGTPGAGTLPALSLGLLGLTLRLHHGR